MSSVWVCCECIHEYPELPFYCPACGCKEFRKVGTSTLSGDDTEYQLIKKDLFG